MSYIRSGSNPECLYIYGARDGVYIHGGSAREGLVLPRYDYVVSYEDWEGICQTYVNGDSVVDADGLTTGEEFRFGNFHLEYRHVESEDGWRQVLTHNDGWQIVMWDVTWAYITRRFKANDDIN